MHQKIELAVQLGQERIAEGAAVAGWVGGSLTAGLGTERSDVDLFLVVDGPLPPIEQVLRDGVRIDIECRARGYVETLVAGLQNVPMHPEQGLDDVPPVSRLDDAARLLFAVPVESLGAAYVESARKHADDLRKCRIIRSCSIISSKREDVQGSIEGADWRQALEVSGRLLLEALEAYTAGCGLTYVGHKWSIRKLMQTPDHAILLSHVDELLYATVLPDWEQVVEHRVRLAQGLLASALCLGWDAPAGGSWAGVIADHAGQGRFPVGPKTTDTQWVPVRYGDDVLLEGLDKTNHVRMSVPGLLLWGLCAALGAESAVLAFPTLAKSLLPDMPPAHELETYVRSMVDQGLLDG